MIDAIKKTLLAGVGAAVITKDKIEAALSDFVKQGKVSSTEARAMADKIAEQGRREFDTLSRELNEKFRDTFTGAEQKYRDRLAALEARLAALEKAAAKRRVRRADKPSEPA
jgi:polyhydroxyalkanoate synthesis regulator phasin